MKPHEVIKESLENFEVEYQVTKFASALRGMSFQMELRRDFKKTIIDSQLSLLLSVKEVVGYNQAIEEVLSILNKYR